MEQAQQLLLKLHDTGVQLYLDDQARLAFRSSRKLEEEERAEIRRNKTALSRMLKGASSQPVKAEAVLSCNQQSLCFLCQDERLNNSYLITFALAFENKPDAERLKRALTLLQAEQPALRTGFQQRDGRFYLRRDEQVDLPWSHHSLASSELFSRWFEQFAEHSMAIGQPSLWRLCFVEKGDYSWLAVQVHHLVWDGWSSALFRKLLVQAWNRAEKTDALPLSPKPGADLFATEQQRRASEDYWKDGLEYWQSLLVSAPEQTKWSDRRAGQPAGAAVQQNIIVAGFLVEASERFLKLLTAWLLAQAYEFGEEHLVTGVPVANRHYSPELENALGYFNNVIPVVADNLLAIPPQQLYKKLAAQWQKSMAYQDVPFDRIVNACQRGRTDGINPIFQNSFAYQSFDWKKQSNTELAHSLISAPSVLAKFPLTLQVAELDDGLNATVEYDSEIFNQTEIDRLLQSWQSFLDQLIVGEEPASQSNTKKDVAVAQSQAWVKGETFEFPADMATTLPEALKQTGERYPEKGLRFIEADGSESRLSYAQLYQRAEQLAAGLQEGQPWPQAGQPVIVLSDALQDYVENFWVVMLAGGIPVTLAAAESYDDERSSERLLAVWQHLEQPQVICDGTCAEKLSPVLLQHPDMQVVVPTNLKSDETYIPWAHQPDDVAIFQLSSGSTGIPKCIQQSHKAIVRFSVLTCHSRGYQPEHISLNWLSFDHVGGLLLTLLRDICLGREQIHLATRWVLEDPLRWPLTMARYGVTHSWSPNFGFKLIANAARQQPERVGDLSSVVELMNGGEMVVADTLRDMNEAFEPWQLSPEAQSPIFGMAESCTVIVNRSIKELEESILSSDRITMGADQAQLGLSQFVSLGPVMAGTEMRIVDDNNQLLNEYQIGRLQLRGYTITSGYYGAKVATGKALLADGWFDTGDLALLADGELYMTGRGQEMIVVNGTNFFCHELEACAEQVPGVKPTWAAAVGYQQGENEAAALCYVPQSGADVEEVNRQVRLQLAARMQFYPEQICPLDEKEFPKTVSGKIQRRKLTHLLLEQQIQSAVAEVGVSRLDWQSWPHQAQMPEPCYEFNLDETHMADLAGLLAKLRHIHLLETPQPMVLWATPAIAFQLYAWVRTVMQELPGMKVLVIVSEGVNERSKVWPESLNPGLYRQKQGELEQCNEAPGSTLQAVKEFEPTPGYSVVTGASGAIASVLIEHLCDRGEELVLISRSAPDSDWFTKIQNRWPGQCHLVSADIGNATSLSTAWQSLPDSVRGQVPARVYHLAGILVAGDLSSMNNKQLLQDRQLRCHGADNLMALFNQGDQAKAVEWACFSSVNGWRGGSGLGAYNLGNGALCDWVQQQRSQGIKVWWLGWSAWRETGMSVGLVDEQHLAMVGLQALVPEVAVEVLDQLLQQPQADYLIGIQPRQQATNKTASEPMAPEHKRMAEIWSELLDRPVTDPRASFFEQGGNSILLIQLLEKLKQHWQRPELVLTDLFKASTLAEMSHMVKTPRTAEKTVKTVLPRQKMNQRRKRLKEKLEQ